MAAAVPRGARVRAAQLHRLHVFHHHRGEWDECMAVVKEATAAVAEQRLRVSLVLKEDIRPGHRELTASWSACSLGCAR
ncbi:thiamine-binding protein [Kocuria rhizophila]|nr:thiamine-binding protein [Kocuria rhizophila]